MKCSCSPAGLQTYLFGPHLTLAFHPPAAQPRGISATKTDGRVAVTVTWRVLWKLEVEGSTTTIFFTHPDSPRKHWVPVKISEAVIFLQKRHEHGF